MTRDLSIEEAETILKEAEFGHIGCNDGFNTYIFSTNYVYDGKCILCQSMPESKIIVMRENNRVCFQVESVNKLNDMASVTILGEYVEIKKVRERYDALKTFVEKMMHLNVSEEINYLHSQNKFSLNKRNVFYKPVFYKIYIQEIKGSAIINNHTQE